MHYPVPGFGADRRHESHKRRVRSLPSSPKRSVQKEPGRAVYFPTNPTDRTRPGSKHHVLVEANGDPDWREPQRCHATAVAGRRYSVDSRHARADRFASPRSSTPIVATIPTRIARPQLRVSMMHRASTAHSSRSSRHLFPCHLPSYRELAAGLMMRVAPARLQSEQQPMQQESISSIRSQEGSSKKIATALTFRASIAALHLASRQSTASTWRAASPGISEQPWNARLSILEPEAWDV